MTERSFLTVLVSLLLLLASTAMIVSVYLWLVWYFKNHETRQLPLEGNIKGNIKLGLSEADLERLPTIECHEEEEHPSESEGGGHAECAVCLEPFQNKQRCRVLPACNHAFHVQCADAWLSRRSLCPICRRSAACETEDVNGGAAAALQKEDGRDDESRRRPPQSAESVVLDMAVVSTLAGSRSMLYSTD